MSSSFDGRRYRRALGSFTTGVTIVTTRAADGTSVGLTANSFNSLSLDPPMVLWALDRRSLSLAAFEAAEHFAVHVLASHQQALSDRFATRGADKFGALECETGLGSVPLLRDCSARFQCRTEFRYDGGDHVIFVGRVLAFDETDLPPLAFHRGTYGTVTRSVAEGDVVAPGGEGADGSLSSDFLGTLLATAHSGVMRQVRRELARLGLLEAHHQVLVILKAENGLSLGELDSLARLSDQRVTYQTLADLSLRGLVAVEGPDDPATRVHLTAEGDETAIRLGAALKAAEADAERLIGAADAQQLKVLLRGVIRATQQRQGSVPFSGKGV